jgi:hypothetical protein
VVALLPGRVKMHVPPIRTAASPAPPAPVEDPLPQVPPVVPLGLRAPPSEA